MAGKDVEIELRFPLKNPLEVAGLLNSKAKVHSRAIFQKDTYFTPPHRNFLAPKYPYEWLRLRESDKGAFMNYKHWYPEDAEINDYCDEFETGVEKPEAAKKMLARLDFREICVVEKTRNTWIYGDAEIAIDEVKGLGIFMELEAARHFEDARQAKSYLYSILEELNADVGKEDLRGYPFRILQKKLPEK